MVTLHSNTLNVTYLTFVHIQRSPGLCSSYFSVDNCRSNLEGLVLAAGAEAGQVSEEGTEQCQGGGLAPGGPPHLVLLLHLAPDEGPGRPPEQLEVGGHLLPGHGAAVGDQLPPGLQGGGEGSGDSETEGAGSEGQGVGGRFRRAQLCMEAQTRGEK